MTYKCQKCTHYKVDYEFSTEYMSTVAVEKCLLKKPLFNEEELVYVDKKELEQLKKHWYDKLYGDVE